MPLMWIDYSQGKDEKEQLQAIIFLFKISKLENNHRDVELFIASDLNKKVKQWNAKEKFKTHFIKSNSIFI